MAARSAAVEVATQVMKQPWHGTFSNPSGNAIPPSLRGTDQWGHPFGYMSNETCFVVISYGSDGIPDEQYDLSICDHEKAKWTCWLPTMDTVYVNAQPLRACGK